MSALAVLGRTLADSADRESWLNVHDKVIGSSTAGKFAKPESVETYVRQILAPRTFGGNETTRSGHRWEPMLLAWAGAEPNSLFVHHPDNERFACTVDGTKRVGDEFVIVETKAKHMKILDPVVKPDGRLTGGPSPYEFRQLAWQLACVPEAACAEWVWGELIREDPEDPESDWVLRRDPQTIVFDRAQPDIAIATALILPIAHAVLAALDAALTERRPF